MAFDFIAVASYGAYPTPTPTASRRMALAVSMGLLNITLPTPVAVTSIVNLIIGKIKGIFINKDIRI